VGNPVHRGAGGLRLAALFILVPAILALAGSAVAAGDAPSVITYGGDSLRTGWYPNQPSLTPQLLAGGTFGELFSTPVQGQVYAQPLVDGGTVLVATEADWIYGLDATTGAVQWSRNVGTPFNASDVSCADLTPTIGITGTPVVDTASGTEYFLAKSYDGPGATNVNWYMHAVDVSTGAERSGFPVKIAGTAQNQPSISFNAKYELQRPGLLLLNGVVYAAFGGHCDRLPYWGWVVGVSTAGSITAMWATPSTSGNGAGIWQSGGGIVSDGPGQLLVTTGNGMGGGTPPVPTPGKSPPGNLAQSVVRLAVQPDGTLKATDFFAPYDSSYLDSWDGDLGSGAPLELPTPYFGTSQIPHLLVQIGKEGYVYLLNADNLGGTGEGANGSDLVVNRTGPYPNGLWGKVAVWPGDGGYIYVPWANGLQAFKYGIDGTGTPTLSPAGGGDFSDDFGFGSSAGVVTSNGTTSGSAIVWAIWSSDGSGSGAQLRAYNPIPVGGKMQRLWSAPIGQSSKFALPGVGDGKLYVGTRDGHVLGFGSPVNVALTGSALTFPATTVGSSSTLTETLTATTTVTVNGVSTTDGTFSTGTPSTALPATLSAGQTLSIPVTFAPSSGGSFGATLNVSTSAGVLPFGLSGAGQSAAAQLSVSPTFLSFGGTAVGSTKTSTITYTNTGAQPLTVTGVKNGSPPFSDSGMPGIGSNLAPGASVTATVAFAPTTTGTFSDHIVLATSAGNVFTNVSGTATLPGKLVISPLSVSYGTVSVGSSASASFTVSNTGGTAVTITKSKPPALGIFVASTSLSESTTIAPGASVVETVAFTPPSAGSFSDTWNITGDDPTGPQTVTFTGTGASAGGGGTLTVPVAAGGDDGFIEKGDSGYPPSASAAAQVTTGYSALLVRRSWTPYSYEPVSVGLLRFDTSGLPDNAVVTSATLRLNVLSATSSDNRSLVAGWYSAANWPIDASDWTLADDNSAVAGVPLSVVKLGDNDFQLQGLSNISTTGMTGLRLAISGAAVPPTGENGVNVASFENGSAPPARLIINYTVPQSLTVPVAAGGDDGFIEKGDSGYPPSASTAAQVTTGYSALLVRRSWTPYSYEPVSVGLLRFDTSGLPDNAVVTSATLRLNVLSATSSDNRSLVAGWYSAANWPIDASDWTLADDNSAVAGVPLSVVKLGDNDFQLQGLSNISTTGMTGLRLAISGAAVPPTGENGVNVASFENGSAPPARLIITYTTG